MLARFLYIICYKHTCPMYSIKRDDLIYTVDEEDVLFTHSKSNALNKKKFF